MSESKSESTRPAEASGQPQQPEKKFGPYAGGIGVAIWINTTNDGQRQFRSITISPRRFQDQSTGNWKSAKSFQTSDIPTLQFALRQAQEYMIQNPLRGPDTAAAGEEDIPF